MYEAWAHLLMLPLSSIRILCGYFSYYGSELDAVYMTNLSCE